MSKPLGHLTVCTNPFAAVDHEGRPSGVAPLDPEDPRFYNPRTKVLMAPPPASDLSLLAVGARLKDKPELIRALDPGEAKHSLRKARYDLVWRFKYAPFQVPDTRFYRGIVLEGGLLAADDETARKCGVRFGDVKELRALTRARKGATTDVDWVDPPEPEPAPVAVVSAPTKPRKRHHESPAPVAPETIEE